MLTLEDPHGRFDGIVFGELSPGRWMAGSDNFHHTPSQTLIPPRGRAKLKLDTTAPSVSS